MIKALGRTPLFLVVPVVTVIILAFFVTACHRGPQRESLAPSDWHDFQGTWTAAGSRSIMKLGGNRTASISRLTGSLLLSGPSRPAVGFRADAVVFNDSQTGMIGRAVWTDEHGDEAFSELTGVGNRINNKIFGTFTGGTGRYAGANGTYEFSWKFLLESDETTVQGQSVGLAGRVRIDLSNTGPRNGGRQP